MNEEMFQLFVAIAMHAAIGKCKPGTVEDIAVLAVKQAEAIEKILNRKKRMNTND